jgi:hypothetical protein
MKRNQPRTTTKLWGAQHNMVTPQRATHEKWLEFFSFQDHEMVQITPRIVTKAMVSKVAYVCVRVTLLSIFAMIVLNWFFGEYQSSALGSETSSQIVLFERNHINTVYAPYLMNDRRINIHKKASLMGKNRSHHEDALNRLKFVVDNDEISANDMTKFIFQRRFDMTSSSFLNHLDATSKLCESSKGGNSYKADQSQFSINKNVLLSKNNQKVGLLSPSTSSSSSSSADYFSFSPATTAVCFVGSTRTLHRQSVRDTILYRFYGGWGHSHLTTFAVLSDQNTNRTLFKDFLHNLK